MGESFQDIKSNFKRKISVSLFGRQSKTYLNVNEKSIRSHIINEFFLVITLRDTSFNQSLLKLIIKHITAMALVVFLLLLILSLENYVVEYLLNALLLLDYARCLFFNFK